MMDRQANLRGASWMVAMMFMLAILDVIMKFMMTEMPLFQALFVRGCLLLPVTALILVMRQETKIKIEPQHRLTIAYRILCEMGLSLTMLMALMTLPLANVTIILQAVPLGMVAAAALILKEQVGVRRWSAVVIGFIGVVIIIQPGAEGFTTNSFYAVTAALLFIIRDILVRRLPSHYSTTFLAAPMVLAITIMGGVMIPFTGWVPVQMHHLILLFLAGLAIGSTYLMAVHVMRIADVGFVSPFRYSGILFAIIGGILFFDEWPDRASLIGATLIVGAGLYALHREQLNR